MVQLKHKGDQKYILSVGMGAAKGLYNLYNSETDQLSYWFEKETKDKLIKLNNKEFNKQAGELINC